MGENPLYVERIADKLREAAGSAGPGGIFTLALAAIDLALWDLKGKALGQPVHALLGGYRDRAPTYASGALMRDFPTPYLKDAGPRLVDMGFRQMKMQLGGDSTVERELERVRLIRDGIGPDIDLMCDINQLWNVNQAIDMGHRLAPFDLFWLEDVVAHDDFQGLARVADALTTPIATGEYHYGIVPFRHMLEARSLDIVMVDVLRAGGITPVDENRRHGRGLQPAGGQPPVAGGPRPHDGRHPQWAHHRVHALEPAAVRGNPGDRGRPTGRALPSRPGSRLLRRRHQAL